MKTLKKLIQEANGELNDVVRGIDTTEVDDDRGWWETSVGAEFGAEVKKKLESFIKQKMILAARGMQEAMQVEEVDYCNCYEGDCSYCKREVLSRSNDQAAAFLAGLDDNPLSK